MAEIVRAWHPAVPGLQEVLHARFEQHVYPVHTHDSWAVLVLDDHLTENLTLTEASDLLGAHRSHLARVFSQAYGIAPHHYVSGRRVDRARRLLLAGRAPADVAAEAGFHDQAHLTRHFRKVLGTTPGAFVG